MKPMTFKVRTQGHCTGAKGGAATGAKGGAGAIWQTELSFTVATSPDQWLLTGQDQSMQSEPPAPAAPSKPFTYLSVCSGMEAATVAWHPLGWTPVGFSEIEPFPCAILKHRFPNIPNHGDLTKYAEWKIEPGTVDLLVGGTPCQAFSTAGLRRGLADPRGNLALVFLGLADRIKPRWIVWENVPGVLNSNGGRDFRSFLCGLRELGYSTAYRVLDAQWFGVAQRRRRVFCVAFRDSGDWRPAAAVLSLIEGVCWHSPSGKGKRQTTPPGLGDGVGKGRWEWPKSVASNFNAIFGSKLGLDNEHCLNAGAPLFVPAATPINTMAATRPEGSDQNRQTFGIGQPGDPQFTISANHPHAVAQPIAIQGTIIGRSKTAGPQGTGATEGGPMFTLTRTDIHGVAHSIPIQDGREIEKKQNGMGIGQHGEPSYTIDTTGAQSVAHCSDVAQPIAFQHGNLKRHAGSDPSSTAFPPLTCGSGDQSPCVAQPIAFDAYNQSVSDTAQSVCSARTDINHIGGVVQNLVVRRLTPRECERLQGFPDDWSRIPWKGKPEEECPDGPRYKACGNSMAVPVMRWIGSRIAAWEALQK